MPYAIIMILGGIIAASSWIIAKRPDAKQMIDKIVPYQGWIGVVLFIVGILSVLGSLALFSVGFIIGIISLAASLVSLALGFILAYALISKYALSKNEAAMKKGEELRLKLTKIQIPLGFAAIILGVLDLLYYVGVFRF